MELSLIHAAAVSLVGAAAAWADVKTARIPNWITVTGFCSALVIAALSGWPALGWAVVGATLAAALSIPLFFLRVLGGGDAKLLIAVGAFLGPGRLGVAVVATAIAGGVLALLLAFKRGTIVAMLMNSKEMVVNWLTLGRHGYRPSVSAPGSVSIPYGVAIALGALAGRFL